MKEINYFHKTPHLRCFTRIWILILDVQYWWYITWNMINSFVPNSLFLYPLITLENRKVFLCFQRVEKGCIWNKWVKEWFHIKVWPSKPLWQYLCEFNFYQNYHVIKSLTNPNVITICLKFLFIIKVYIFLIGTVLPIKWQKQIFCLVVYLTKYLIVHEEVQLVLTWIVET